MTKQELIKLASDFTDLSAENRIEKGLARSESVAGMRIFDAPVFAFGSAEDPLFLRMKDPAVVGPHFRLPAEWLPQAKTVVSFFLPFTEAVRKSNRRDRNWPSDGWLHGRIEGQTFVSLLCTHLQDALIQAGSRALVPVRDSAYRSDIGAFTSNWSERHVAYICGLGTFGLSRGLITRKGMAGRFGSLITDLPLPPDMREYDGVYDYCLMCGACAKNCPVGAISPETGKDHRRCSDFLKRTEEKFRPRYGCGKCQVGVPCESRIPINKRRNQT